MYTYLNQRYGLKSLIVEWASAIINGVKTFLKEDHDVSLFGKILKNECDEEFRYIQMHVKDTLQGILKSLLKERYFQKSEAEIARTLEQVQAGTMEEYQWRRIIEKMYDPSDAEVLESKFLHVIEERRSQNYYSNLLGAATDGRKLTREQQFQRIHTRGEERLPYGDFQKIILDFQLKEHEKFLERFISVFKSVDDDSNGVLSEEEFRMLLERMRVVDKEEEVLFLLQLVDPFNNQ